jgi:hypothetical protein
MAFEGGVSEAHARVSGITTVDLPQRGELSTEP